MRGDGLQQAEVPVHGPQPTKDDPYQSTRQALAGPTTSNEAARPAPDVPAQPMESTLTTAAVGGAAIKPPEQKSSIQQEFDLQEMARLADYTYGERSPEAGAARAKLAGFYRANGDNKRADAYYQAAIERLGRSSDNFYVQILTGTLNDYAAFKKDMGQTSESAQLKKRSDAIHNLSVSEAELSQAATNGEPDSNIDD